MAELQVPKLMERIEVLATRPQWRNQYPRRIAEHKACGRLGWVLPRLDDGARFRRQSLEMLVHRLHFGFGHGAPFSSRGQPKPVSGWRFGGSRGGETAANSRQ